MKPQPRALLHRLAAAASAGPALHAVGDGPTLGYSPANMDKRVRLRKDFYRNAAGPLLERAEIPAGEPEINAFTQLSINLDQQLLKLIMGASSASPWVSCPGGCRWSRARRHRSTLLRGPGTEVRLQRPARAGASGRAGSLQCDPEL